MVNKGYFFKIDNYSNKQAQYNYFLAPINVISIFLMRDTKESNET